MNACVRPISIEDGKPDVVTTDLDQNAVSILLGDGKGGLHDAPGSPFPAGEAPWAVAIDDMNSDGNLDLVVIPYAPDVRDPKDVAVTVLLGDGKGGFRKAPSLPLSLAGCEGPDRVSTGDINGDGFRDIVVTCAQNNKLMLYFGSKDGHFQVTERKVQTGWAGVAVADLQGRGKSDIVVSNGFSDAQTKPAIGTIYGAFEQISRRSARGLLSSTDAQIPVVELPSTTHEQRISQLFQAGRARDRGVRPCPA